MTTETLTISSIQELSRLSKHGLSAQDVIGKKVFTNEGWVHFTCDVRTYDSLLNGIAIKLGGWDSKRDILYMAMRTKKPQHDFFKRMEYSHLHDVWQYFPGQDNVQELNTLRTFLRNL